jgi:superfamily II DNA or RNA helicase
MIARRGVNTLVLVHRTELAKQWQERLQAFLGTGRDVVGTIGGGKTDVKIIDFVDIGHPALLRMWDKRQLGYRAMGHRIEAGTGSNDSLL